jgi:hypothetical protein
MKKADSASVICASIISPDSDSDSFDINLLGSTKDIHLYYTCNETKLQKQKILSGGLAS